nr:MULTISPECIES: hypothetical protein [Bradyrhizobium]
MRKSDYRVERNLSDRMKLRLNEVWRKDEVGGIDVGHSLGISRALVQGTTDVIGTADERLASVVMPMPELMTGAEPFPVRSRPIAHMNDRAILEADDLSLAADEPPVENLRADAIGDGEKVDFLGLGNAEFHEELFGWPQEVIPSACRTRQ